MTVARREFIRTGGLLVASIAAIPAATLEAFAQRPASAAGPYPDPDFLQLDSWIVIRPDNTATFFVGKTDLGQGTGTAFRQIMSDELDIDFEKTTCVMGSTDVTVDQGGSGGSDALQTDGYPMRRVAAEARRVLLEMASTHFGVPVTALVVRDGVVSTNTGDSADRSITYGELIGGKKFNVTLTGRNVDATTGKAALKPVQAMKNVGKSPRRDDIPAKVDGTQRWAVDMKVPGMLHARNVRPPLVGATLARIDESSVADVPVGPAPSVVGAPGDDDGTPRMPVIGGTATSGGAGWVTTEEAVAVGVPSSPQSGSGYDAAGSGKTFQRLRLRSSTKGATGCPSTSVYACCSKGSVYGSCRTSSGRPFWS